MASTNDSLSLGLWSLATFRVASLTASVVMLFHLRGSLSATLSRLDTATGFGGFALLWATTWFATRTGLRYMQRTDSFVERRVASTIVAGGRNGVYVFFILLVVFSLFTIKGQSVRFILAVVLIGSTIGNVFAFVVGGLVGLLYGLVDATLFGFSAWLFRWAAANERSSAGV